MMKRTSVTILMIVIVSTFCVCITTSMAGDRYLSKNPPSNELIIKVYFMMWQGKYKITEIIGKRKTSDNTFQVFYNYVKTSGNKFGMDDDIQLIKLDSNAWIIRLEKGFGDVQTQVVPQL